MGGPIFFITATYLYDIKKINKLDLENILHTLLAEQKGLAFIGLSIFSF